MSTEQRSLKPLIIGLAAAIAVVVAVIGVGVYVMNRPEENQAPEPTFPSAAPEPEQDLDARGYNAPRSDAVGRKVMVPRNGVGQPLDQDPAGSKGFDDPGAFTEPAAGIEWQQTGGVVTPFSTSDGPTRMDGKTPRGFARTPAGAALASATYTWRLMDGSLASEAVEKTFDPATENYQQAVEVTAKMGPGDTVGDKMPRPSGYEVSQDKCDPDYCAPTFSMPLPDGTSQSIPGAAVVWVDGDWKGVYTPAGESRQGTDAGLVRW